MKTARSAGTLSLVWTLVRLSISLLIGTLSLDYPGNKGWSGIFQPLQNWTLGFSFPIHPRVKINANPEKSQTLRTAQSLLNYNININSRILKDSGDSDPSKFQLLLMFLTSYIISRSSKLWINSLMMNSKSVWNA